MRGTDHATGTAAMLPLLRPLTRQVVHCLSGWRTGKRKNLPQSVKKTATVPNKFMKAGDTRHRPRHGHGRDPPLLRPLTQQVVHCLSGWRTGKRKNPPQSVKKTETVPNRFMKAGDTRHKPRHGHGRDAPLAPAADTAGCSLHSGWSTGKRKNFPQSVKKTATVPNKFMKAGDTRHRPRS